MPFIQVTNLTKTYTGLDKPVLSNLDFACEKGEMVCICGASGVGKSTLLHIIGGLDQPTGGVVAVSGREIYKLKEKELANFRNKTIGFVFQFFHLLSELTALENAMLPCLIGGLPRGEAASKAVKALEEVGLAHRIHHRPAALSGGECQRVAIARAIVMKPDFVFADEPTGNLDQATGASVLKYLIKLNREHGIGLIMATHNAGLIERMPRKLELREGKLWGS